MNEISTALEAIGRAWTWLSASFARAVGWLVGDPPAWSQTDLQVFLHWIVALLIVVHLALVVVQRRQAETPTQRGLTRFLWAKTAFWCVVELSFHIHLTRLWVAADYLVLIACAITALDLLTRLLLRYVFVRRGEPTSPHI